MLEAIAEALATPGIWWLVGGVCAAGIVRGFSGFGSAMIIMPVASSVLPPVQAVVFTIFAELIGPLPNLPAAWRDGAPRNVGVLMLGAFVGLPIGLLCLSFIDPAPFGWIISATVTGLLILMISGWRYSGTLTQRLTVATGTLGGFMTGFAGIPGPPVIMLYMASKLPIAVIRANLLMYLLAADVLLIALMAGAGMMVWPVALLGLLVGVPNVIANMIGALMFRPDAERVFRTVSYIVITASAIIGLPIWRG